ncbi:MAG: Flp family type IVb pilin [Candidatus Riflebacteria bacterium]|nr:Flp family type IVb pilin [Candidatus Riflebacteria bacterium]
MNRFFREEEGQGLVEYALIIGLIAIVAIAALSAAGGSVSGLFNNINGKLNTANSGNGLGGN